MRKIRFMVEEFFRSFRKGFLKNLLLMAMFSISLVMAVIMGAYYFDMGDRYTDATKQVEDSTWCDLELMTENYSEIENSFTTVSGCQNMMDYYETLRSSENCPIISLDTPIIYMKEDDIKGFFGDRSYVNFQSEEQRESLATDFGDDGTCNVLNMKCAQVDLGAYRYFGLRTQEGEGFTEQNMRLRHVSDPIPILLGNDYKGIIEPGSELDIWCWNFVYTCRVTGILEKGATLPSRQGDVDVCQLDSMVLFPFGIQLTEPAETVDQIKKYANLSYLGLEFGIAQIKNGSMREQTAVFRDAGKEFGLPAVQMVGTSMGVSLLRNESAASIAIMLILSVTLSCFTLYGIFITFYDRIQSNSRIYGIYLMNGCSMGMIMIPLLAEIAVILVPAVLLGRFLFLQVGVNADYQPEAVMRIVYMSAGLVFAAGAGFVAFLMRGVDTERLIRQKD